jgi:hypothetical protein
MTGVPADTASIDERKGSASRWEITVHVPSGNPVFWAADLSNDLRDGRGSIPGLTIHTTSTFAAISTGYPRAWQFLSRGPALQRNTPKKR